MIFNRYDYKLKLYRRVRLPTFPSQKRVLKDFPFEKIIFGDSLFSRKSLPKTFPKNKFGDFSFTKEEIWEENSGIWEEDLGSKKPAL